MNSLKFFQDQINKELADLFQKAVPSPKELYEPINYMLAMDGKRIRPALLLMASEMFGGDWNLAVSAALGIEMFHNFTLVHDDIMDKAPLRRNNPTIHSKWNENIAILSGDVMLVKAYQYISKCDSVALSKTLHVFSIIAAQVCEGQALDMNFETLNDVSIEDYLNMIGLKTAVLLAGSLKIGAILGGASENDAEHMYEFGKNLGLAFQLQDDILDVFGQPDKFGKQVGGDILSNKKTFLLLKAMEMARGELLTTLNENLEAVDFAPEEKIKSVTTIYNQLNVKEIAEQKMSEFYEKALEHIDLVDISSERKKNLKHFAENLLKREK